MSELILLTLVKKEFHKLYQRARQGDESALAELDAMWNEYRDQTLPCFLCDSEVPYPVRTIMMPEYRDQRNIIAAPLCTKCADLPQGTKLHRSIKVLRQMNKHKSPGKQIHYTFARHIDTKEKPHAAQPK